MNQILQKLLQQILLIMKETNKPKETLHSILESEQPEVSSRGYANTICPNCWHWEHKTKELIWGYQELAEAKQQEVQSLSNMINQLDQEINTLRNKNQALSKRFHQSQLQVQQLQNDHQESQRLIQYYKDREVDLLTQLKAAQNELFSKTVQVNDEIDIKKQKAIEALAEAPKQEKKINKQRTESQIMPILKSSQSLGKILQHSLADIEKIGRDKLVAELKHRMAVLKAVELSILK